jgi:hypothetical protein
MDFDRHNFASRRPSGRRFFIEMQMAASGVLAAGGVS